jgi:hypothetical protein
VNSADGFLKIDEAVKVNEDLQGRNGDGNAGAFCTANYAVGLSKISLETTDTSRFW